LTADAAAAQLAAGDTTYLNPATGADTNAGTRQSPLKTMAEAAKVGAGLFMRL
jgi:hypothetical protein